MIFLKMMNQIKLIIIMRIIVKKEEKIKNIKIY